MKCQRRKMKMNQCKTCKFFKRHNESYKWNKYGECQSKKILYGASQPNETVNAYDDDYPYKGRTETDLLLYEDAEGYDAYHEVGEDFGCIHYEEAEK